MPLRVRLKKRPEACPGVEPQIAGHDPAFKMWRAALRVIEPVIFPAKFKDQRFPKIVPLKRVGA